MKGQCQITAVAIYLYALTGQSSYKTYVESNYDESHLIQWNFVYPFENPIQLSLLYYAHLKGVSTSVAEDIINAFRSSIDNDPDNYPSFTGLLMPTELILKMIITFGEVTSGKQIWLIYIRHIFILGWISAKIRNL